MKKRLAMLIALLMLATTTFTYAASDPAVVLVSPTINSTVYSNNLLVSVKVTQPGKTIKVKVLEERQLVNGTTAAINLATMSAIAQLDEDLLRETQIGNSDTFVSTNSLSFYTKQINDLKPGLYKIKLDTIDKDGKILFTKESYVSVKEKPVEQDKEIFNSQPSGTMQILQSLLKTIFGN